MQCECCPGASGPAGFLRDLIQGNSTMLTWDDVKPLPSRVNVDPVTKQVTVRVSAPLDFKEIRAAFRPSESAKGSTPPAAPAKAAPQRR